MTFVADRAARESEPVLFDGRPWHEADPGASDGPGTLDHRPDGPSGCVRCGWRGVPSYFGGRRGRRRDPMPGCRGHAIEGGVRSDVCPACRTPGEREADQADPSPRTTAQTVRRRGPKVGRNDPCPCGSRRKAKKCCGAAP